MNKSFLMKNITHPLFRLPDRATKSLGLSPKSPKEEIRVSRGVDGAGRPVFARARLAVVESLLPSLGVHDGPPT